MPILGVAGDVVSRLNGKRRTSSGRAIRKNRAKKNRDRSKNRLAIQVSSRPQPGKRVVRADPVLKQRLLYVLELEDGKYYVGQTSSKDATKRFNQHVSGGKRAAKWTKLHKPLRILETREIGECSVSTAAIAEDDLTIEYMSKYGIGNVRGGGMCQVVEAQVIKAYEAKLIRVERSQKFVERRNDVEAHYQERLGKWYRENL
ncbi:GIY-YIG nuclease family protein [Mycolicibacterium wolinskyi]|uniref:GIY-YIG nuclease family protein n=1 Tax=Mycolicibacterium wolinskyi TaxID=59750 RepID=UPI0039176DC6